MGMQDNFMNRMMCRKHNIWFDKAMGCPICKQEREAKKILDRIKRSVKQTKL